MNEWLTQRIDKDGDCWIWNRAKTNNGYGIYTTGGRTTVAHRYVYKLLVGDIPQGLTLDHLCRRRDCVNPKHLEPVTLRENVKRGSLMQSNNPTAVNARKTHCIRGHALSGDNLRVRPQGKSFRRYCMICLKEKERLRWQKTKVQSV